MKMANKLLCAAAGLALAGCVAATPGVSDTVGPGYATGGGTWNTGGGITVAATVIDHQGHATVCGVWTIDRQSALTSDLNSQVMQAGIVEIAGDRLVQNIAFMTPVPYADNVTGKTASCYVTETPWKSAYDSAKPVIKFPVMTFSEVAPPAFNRITFRPGPRPSILG